MSFRLYAVTRPDYPEDERTIVVSASGRKTALRLAIPELGGDPETYVIDALAAPKTNKVIWTEPRYRA